MARIRTLKPEYWGHPKTAKVSRDARLLFIGLLNESDDEGRQLGSPRRIAGTLFPHDEDVTTSTVRRWLDELEEAGFVQRYEVEGVAYLVICGFTTHQRVNRPTKSHLPPPRETSLNDHGGLTEPSSPYLGSRNKDLGSETAAEQGAGSGTAPQSLRSPRKRGTSPPPTIEITTELRRWALANAPGVDLARETEKLLDWARSKGEVKRDWIATWRNWMRRAHEDRATSRNGDELMPISTREWQP